MSDIEAAFRLSERYQQLKGALHLHLIELLEDRGIDIGSWSDAKATEFLRGQARIYVNDHRIPINQHEIHRLADDTLDELIGYGPIQPLIDDPEVDDIVVNGPAQVYTERRGRLVRESIRFAGDAHILRVAQRILAPLGRRLDESTPMVDARLPDGSRVNAIIAPLALDGPCLSIRKFGRHVFSADDLVASGSVSAAVVDYLRARIAARENVIVVGGTGSGKTTFLNMISQWIDDGERIITIEDAAELRLAHPHVVRLETRPPNLEGERAVSARDLLRNALRMRPDRIILGEVRGDEVLDMLQAMNTGHDGSMTTLHANGPRDAIHRLQLLAGFAGFTGDERMFVQQIASTLDLIVHVARLSDGRRRLLSIDRVGDLVENQLQLHAEFVFDAANDRYERRPASTT